MKKIFLFVVFLQNIILFAQAPQKMSYQSVVRNANNSLVANQVVGVRISFIQGSETGATVYSETHTVTTNANGLFTLQAGDGTPVFGTFTSINWSNFAHYIKSEIDPLGGTNYTLNSTKQLLSVPYALYANNSGNGQSTSPNLANVLAASNSANNTKIVDLLDPTNAQDAVTKLYTDTLVTQLQTQLTNLQTQITALQNANPPTYPAGTVFCTSGATAIVNVTNPTTGKIWMDRNLGASQVATSSTDAASYGDLYQWGRRADGHQCRNSATTTALSSVDQPVNGNFIMAPNSPWDWRSPQNNNLWQGVNGVNNPCPSGYRLPTETELTAERTSWSSNNAAGAFASPLKLPLAGNRIYTTAMLISVGIEAEYFSSTASSIVSTAVRGLAFFNNFAYEYDCVRAHGGVVRCLKD